MALNPADIAIVSRLLDEALALSPIERDAWLRTLPPEMQRHAPVLQDMLAAAPDLSRDERLASLPRLDAADESVAAEGDLIGPYRLLRELGRGGMGSVWLAERADGAFKRQVALKLPRLAWGAGLAQRMARERDIGARLEHPHIARLYDAGVDERGRPFLALEYIDGVPIDAWCRMRQLDVRARLDLFLQVIRAVSYAHGRLVVHRDLKPSNVLVSADGQAHLLDFGIAKLLADAAPGDTGLTQQQGRVMTPHYASPEQVAGEPITVQSDVYSLGVLLYELLSGTLPIAPRRGTLGAMEEAILQGDAPPASSRAADRPTAAALRGEIDAILAKAMQRDTARRYASADAPAQDIERHLNGQTVSARPDSAVYRLRKAAARHWLPLTAGSVIAGSLVVGGSVAWVQAQRAAQQADRARMVTQFVSEMFKVSAQSSLNANASAESLSTGQVIEPAAKLIDTRFSGQPDLQAQMFGALGQVYAELGITRAAVQFTSRQLQAIERGAAPPEDRARGLMLLADALARDGKAADALGRAEEAVSLLEPGSALAFDARALHATLLSANSQRDRARQAVDELSRSKFADPHVPSMGGARLLRLKALALYGTDRTDESFPLTRAAIAMASTVEGESSDFTLRTMTELTRWLSQVGRKDEARGVYEDALRRLRSAGEIGQLRAALLTANYLAFGGGASTLPFAQVIKMFEDGLATVQRFGPAAPPALAANIRYLLATVELDHGRVESAYRHLDSAIPILRAATDRQWVLWDYAEAMGRAAMMVGRHDEADRDLRIAKGLRESLGFKSEPWAAYDWVAVAHNLMMQGRVEPAAQWLKDAPTFGEQKSDAEHGADFAKAIPRELARIRLEAGDPAGALQALPAAAADEAANEENSTFALHAVRGEALCAAGQAASGLSLLSAWIAAVASQESELSPSLARVRATAALCALKAGDRQRAEALGALAQHALQQQPGVAAWFRKPLDQLQQALRPGGRKTG
ncbi:serine/threonine-protein kinase [Aquabacterium sp.]|uniref:serine/threonine-protein kinase n=1 Tax=Aquabacterium sp. TaxID=1872578 RepID=UPI0037852CA4